jgi:hypothetical protein
MFYVLVKFKSYPEPIMMGTKSLQSTPMLATMDDVEWVSPSISNGNALVYRHELGGDILEGANDYYISAYRPKPPVPARQDQEELAKQATNWETVQITARKFGFSAE